MAKPTENELVVLKKFRAITADLILTPEQRRDLDLLRWLRARDLNLSKADDMLRKALVWRKQNDIENILTWKPPDFYKKEFPYEVCGKCPDGTPILVLSFGKWDVRKEAENGRKETWLRHIDQMFATTFNVMRRVNEKIPKDQTPVTQYIMIVDFEGYQMRQITHVSSVQTILESVSRFESNYPETVQAMYFINAPRIFSIFFSIIKPVMSTRTLDKVQIYSSNKTKWQPVLLSYIPPDQLPCAYGGTNTETCQFLSKDYNATPDVKADEVGLIPVVIGAGQTLKLEYDIRKLNTVLIWAFKSESYDIGFSILYNDKDVVLPCKKVDAHLETQNGSHNCEKPGKYTVVFDNTHSKMRAKNLHYIVNTSEPQI